MLLLLLLLLCCISQGIRLHKCPLKLLPHSDALRQNMNVWVTENVHARSRRHRYCHFSTTATWLALPRSLHANASECGSSFRETGDFDIILLYLTCVLIIILSQTFSLGCHIHNGTYLTLSLTLTITLTLLTLPTLLTLILVNMAPISSMVVYSNINRPFGTDEIIAKIERCSFFASQCSYGNHV